MVCTCSENEDQLSERHQGESVGSVENGRPRSKALDSSSSALYEAQRSRGSIFDLPQATVCCLGLSFHRLRIPSSLPVFHSAESLVESLPEACEEFRCHVRDI